MRGKNDPISASFGSILSLPISPSGMRISRYSEMRRATSSTESTSSAISIRRMAGEGVDQHRNPRALGRSNSSAGPPLFTARSANSVISSTGSTSNGMRFSSPLLLQRANEVPQVAICHVVYRGLDRVAQVMIVFYRVIEEKHVKSSSTRYRLEPRHRPGDRAGAGPRGSRHRGGVTRIGEERGGGRRNPRPGRQGPHGQPGPLLARLHQGNLRRRRSRSSAASTCW